jgi:ribosomal peptide maturation radical SAM protein 1
MDGSPNVVFAVMPFADPSMPTLGVSLLKAACTRDGVPSTIRYFNIDFVDRIGVDVYRRIANSFPPESLVGEWFFADLVFGAEIPHEDDYLTNILSRYPDAAALMPEIRKARRRAREFVDWCASEIAALQPSVVGFPTTFHQTCACLAVAKKLKELPSSPIVIFGGANCEGEMGHQMLQSFPWLDYVCTQEGDIAFPEFLRQLLRGGTPQVPGIAGRHDNGGAAPPLVEEMDSLPVPDFAEYFERIGKASWAEGVDVHLLLETSRGCWWGAKQHCTFCGLNGATMAYRSKSPERAFDEIRELVTRYAVKRVECVDNILDNRYISTVFPRLAASGLGIDLFYEVKANLRLDQLQAMRAGGMTSIQPGIESLSTRVLQVMQKGVSAAQNIQLLRWCGEVGINVAWNLLGGFPREPMEEYDRQAAIIPLLVHLQPPASCGKFRLDRFSPHFTRPESLGIERIRPMAAYFYVYPLTRRGLMRLAYYFDFDHMDGREPDTYIGSAGSEVHKWWACRTNSPESAPVLDAFENASGEFTIHDTRPCRVAAEHELKDLSGALYALCDTAHVLGALVRTTGRPAEEIQPVLKDLLQRKLMLEIDGQYLSLAVMRRRVQKPIARNNHDWIQIAAAQTAEPLPSAV